jgi:hypothetical protein
MKEIEIDLSKPFEKVLELVLALPKGSVHGAGDGPGNEELAELVRGLHEAANGRQVETEIGLIAIAPPIVPILKAMPFRAATLKDFLVAAAAQIVSLPLHRNGRSPTSLIANQHRKQRTKADRRLNRPPVRCDPVPPVSPAEGPDFLTPQIAATHHD